MKVFEWLKGKFSRDKPLNLYRYSGAPFFFGKSKSGKDVTEFTAMQLAAVYACVKILSESVASLPLHIYKYSAGGKEKLTDHPLYFLLHDAPNEEMTSFTFRETLMVHLLLRGNAYAQVVRNYAGQVIGLYPLMPTRMSVNRDDEGKLYYLYQPISGENSRIQKSGQIRLEAKEILHIHGLGFDGLVGYSPIAVMRNTIGIAIACEEFGATFFANGARPSGILEHPGLLKNPEALRESWQAVYGGSENSGKVAILEEGMKYQQIAIPPDDAQFLETRKFQIAEIARIFRVPLHFLNELDRATFSNIEQQSLEYVTYTLTPWVVRWEQALNKALFTAAERGKFFVKFNLSGLLRGDYESRMKGFQTAIQAGIMTINEVREFEDMNKITAEEGGDLHLINGAITQLKDAGLFGKKAGDTDEK